MSHPKHITAPDARICMEAAQVCQIEGFDYLDVELQRIAAKLQAEWDRGNEPPEQETP